MCGIAGMLMLDGRVVDPYVLRRMTETLAHRGPDGDGHWRDRDGALGLGHRRLVIIDPSPAAGQPMHYRERYTVVYNGEIYN